MLIKAGVDISRLRDPIRDVLGVIADYLSYRDDEIVVTSTYEGNHIPHSKHYANLAIDVSSRDGLRRNDSKAIAERLSSDFDVVPESDHIHIEYDPNNKY